MGIINKYLQSSFHLIHQIENNRNFTIKVGRTNSHAFNGRSLKFSRSDNKYTFETTTKILKGVQTHREFDINDNTQIELSDKNLKLFTEGKNFFLNHISYPDFNSPKPISEKMVKGEITSLSNKRNSYYSNNRCYRMVLPLNKKVALFGDFIGYSFLVDGKRYMETLLKLKIRDKDYHLFVYKENKSDYFFVIDSLNAQSLKGFQEVCNSILLGYAFLKGDYHGEQSYILTYNSIAFKDPISVKTQILGGGIYKGFAVHSTKPHSIVSLRREKKIIKDKDGKFIGFDDSDLKRYMVEFPTECFAKLCDQICSKGGILRAVILFISNHTATLELKIPTLFVALENVTKVLIGGDIAPPKLFENQELVAAIKSKIKKAVKEITIIKKELKPEFENEFEEKLYEANFTRIMTGLYNFNRGTNNKKLKEPFDNFGYKLTKEEEDLIFVHRNKFLHGDDFIAMEESYDYEFRELFHISMRLHRMIAVLLLKSSGFSGYILNQAKIHQNISQRKLKETIFLKI